MKKSQKSRYLVCTALAKTGMPLFVLGHCLGLSAVQDSRALTDVLFVSDFMPSKILQGEWPIRLTGFALDVADFSSMDGIWCISTC